MSQHATAVVLLLPPVTGAVWRSALVAALFALHPLHVESVAWVAERKDVLSAFFGLLTLWRYARYAECKMQTDAKSELPGTGLASRLFALGLMSKPMLVTWPFVMLLLDFWPLNRIDPNAIGWSAAFRKAGKALVLEKLPFFALAALSSGVTVVVQHAPWLKRSCCRSATARPMPPSRSPAIWNKPSGPQNWPCSTRSPRIFRSPNWQSPVEFSSRF